MHLPPIAFVGAGNMGSAIISGLQRREQVPAIRVIDQSAAIRERHAATGCLVGEDLAKAGEAAVVVLAVKPQGADAVLGELAPVLGPQHHVISIMAGVTCAHIQSLLPAGIGVVRAMPNTPMAVGRGMIGIAGGDAADDTLLALAEAIFASAGRVLRIEESQMDALTAVSGSGPAYLFAFAEAQLAAAIGLGFDHDQAATLVGETLAGATAYLQSREGFPAGELREQVTSPGGTTAAALAVLAEGDFHALIQRAMQAACARSQELSA